MQDNPDSSQIDDAEDDDDRFTTIKCPLKSIIRRKYREIIIRDISEKSVQSTYMCALGSLLFLNRVQQAFDDREAKFFEQIGEKVIKDCFHSVLQQNMNEFRGFIDNLDEGQRFYWPSNSYFGNATGDLIKTYCTNVTTNLNTHLKKRLREFLKLKVLINNRDSILMRFEEEDINHAISWAVFGNDSIVIRSIDDVPKRERREWLLDMIRRMSWWDIENDNITTFTKRHWFKSLPMWIAMQREIDAFNIEFQRQPQVQPQPNKPNNPPKIKNLSVIPICSFKRTHFPIDCTTLHKLFCGTKIIPRNMNGKQINAKEFGRDRHFYWNSIFDMPKINKLGGKKKKFHFRILSDGVSVSLLYDKEKIESKPINKKEIIDKWHNGDFKYVIGIDPGMNKWHSSVRRTLVTGKEVSNQIFFSKN